MTIMVSIAQEKIRREVLVMKDRVRIHALASAPREARLAGPEEEVLSAGERRELERIERFYLQDIQAKGGA